MRPRALLWSALNDAMPLYAVYALLFSDTGLSTSQISVLFVVWSTTAVLLEVPTGAFADRFTARSALVVAGLVRAIGYLLWITAPGFAGFAIGFVLWGASGALESGAFQSLLYAGLDREGAADRYPGVLGRCVAMAKVVEVMATLAATPLLLVGGFKAVGWVSVGVCLAGSLVAAGFPGADLEPWARPLGYRDLLREGVREAVSGDLVRRLVLVITVLTGLTAIDEYIPLLARAMSVPDPLIPVVMAGLPLAASAGYALAGVGARVRPSIIGLLLGGASALLVGSAVVGGPPLLLVLGGWWVLVNLATVLADARLQNAVRGPARATVTSVAGLGSELVAISMYLAAAVFA